MYLLNFNDIIVIYKCCKQMDKFKPISKFKYINEILFSFSFEASFSYKNETFPKEVLFISFLREMKLPVERILCPYKQRTNFPNKSA